MNLRNIDAEGVHVVQETGTAQYTYSDWRGGLKRYHQRRWGSVEAYNPADAVTPVNLAVVQLLEGVVPSGQNGSGLPGAGSLFKASQSPNASYLIETDPRFASYRQWLGSDYMLAALSTDPATVQKRLGDGFLEQKLLREQIGQLTGQRFLDGYADDEAMFRALMDAGATYAKAWNLVPGVALTAAQMAQLTSDIVWLDAQEVVLPDGRTVTALVPKVYLKPRQGDLAPSGALLAGQRVDLQLSGDLTNAGTITMAATLLTACGSRGPTVAAPEPTAHARNAVILPTVAYGKTATGVQLSKSDDNCDVPASLAQAVQEQLEAPYEFAVATPSANVVGAPTLRLQITDLLANGGGMYSGPKIVQLHGVLERAGQAPVQFNAQRQMFIYFGLPRSTCSMVGKVTYALGGDIAGWLQTPVDGAKLGDY